MKKVFMSLLFMFSFGLAMAFAGKAANTGDKVKESFKKEFAGATSVVWVNRGDYQEASFLLDGHGVQAYYNTNGELQGFGRHIQKDQLPLAVTIKLKNSFKDAADFNDVLEVSNDEGASYWLTVKTQNKLTRVQISPNGFILKEDEQK